MKYFGKSMFSVASNAGIMDKKSEECGMRGIQACYFGEASRSSFLRGLDHQTTLKNKDDSSPLWKHRCGVHHEGDEEPPHSPNQAD